jgi:hypothetical protein
MCLKIVSKTPPVPTGFGYKVYRVQPDGLHSARYSEVVNSWKTWLKAEGGFGNEPGFHIYLQESKAHECVAWYDDTYSARNEAPHKRPFVKVFKVEYRNATKQGIGDGGFTKNARVVVAQEIFIL